MAKPFFVSKESPIQFLMLTGRVPNRKYLQGYNEAALYCNDNCGIDWFLFKTRRRGTLLLPTLDGSTNEA